MFEFIISNLVIMLIISIVVLNTNLILGYIGYLHLGAPAFYAIGAYTFSLLALKGVPFFLALLAGGIVTGFSGFLLGIPTLRLKSHYIGITTFAFLSIVHSLLINLNDLTRGPLGLPGIPRPTLFGYTLNDNLSFLGLTFFITLVIGFIIYRIVHSPFGKILETIRENDVATKSLGKNTFMYKIQTFIISAFFTGIAGGLFASFFNFVSPNDFYVKETVFFLAALMLGGAGSFWGSFIGSACLWILFVGVKFLPLPASAVGPVQMMVYSGMLVGIMLLRPRGIMGKKIKAFERS